MLRAVVLALVVSGCGAGSTGRTTPEPCAAEDAAVRDAEAALETCRTSPPEPWSHGASYDALLAELDAYETSMGFGDDGDETRAQAVATSTWAFLDELAAEVSDHRPLDAAEDAAEALLRDREHDAAMDATAAARAALTALHDLLAAPSVPDCTDEEDDLTESRDRRARC